MEELQGLLVKLQEKVETFNNWTSKLRESLKREGEDRVGTAPYSFGFWHLFTASCSELSRLKELLNEAQSQRFPDTELVTSLREAVETAEKCAVVAQQLISSKVRTRTRLQGEAKCCLTLEELQLFVQQLKKLPCKLPDSELIIGMN